MFYQSPAHVENTEMEVDDPDQRVLSFGYFFVFPFIEHTSPPCTFPDVYYFLEKIVLAVAGCHSCNILPLY